jgi:hypothetical protein
MRLPTKYNVKNIIVVTGVVFQLSAPQHLRAQLGPVLRDLFKSGERQVVKGVVREEASTLVKLNASKNLSKGYKNNISKFWEKYHCTDVIDMGAEFTTEIEKRKNNNEAIIVYLKEILSNPNYPRLYIGICNMYKRDTLKKQEVEYILLGNKINGVGLDSGKLYNLYFNFSQTFAKEELEKLQNFYKCDNAANVEINSIAQKKNIALNVQSCENEDEGGIAETVFAFFLLALLLYFLWVILKIIFNYLKKLWDLINRI